MPKEKIVKPTTEEEAPALVDQIPALEDEIADAPVVQLQWPASGGG